MRGETVRGEGRKQRKEERDRELGSKEKARKRKYIVFMYIKKERGTVEDKRQRKEEVCIFVFFTASVQSMHVDISASRKAY